MLYLQYGSLELTGVILAYLGKLENPSIIYRLLLNGEIILSGILILLSKRSILSYIINLLFAVVRNIYAAQRRWLAGTILNMVLWFQTNLL